MMPLKIGKIAYLVIAIFVLIFGNLHSAHADADITVVNLDNPGEGFHDASAPDPDSTSGGNTGATLGEQRLIAFQYAADNWGALLDSSVEIRVGANFDPLACGSTSAVIGSAGPTTVHRDFPGAPLPNTWYTQALANSIAETDLSLDNDINATFNSAIGTTCSFPKFWYYGLDGNPSGNNIDFVSVVLHELAHGLGFLTFVSLSSGAKLSGYDDAYMLYLEDHFTGKLYPDMTNGERVTASTNSGDLHWIGPRVVADGSNLSSGRHSSGHVEMYAPAFQQPGSSVSHFSTSLSPNQLMEPSYTGPTHDVGLTQALMEDIGWVLSPDFSGCNIFQPGPDWCKNCGPCSEGQGDCDSDGECQDGLICAQNVGANYGWPADIDVCEQPGYDKFPVGNTTVFGSTTTAVNRRAMPFTMPQGGTIESISIYHNGGTGDMLLGVYDGDSLPLNLLADTPPTPVSASAGWQTIDLSTPVSVEAGATIWLAWVFENNPGIRYQSGTPGRAQSPQGWSGGMPDPFGSSSQKNYIYSIYATLSD